MKNQTAVEWLAENIDDLIPYVNDDSAKKFNELVEQAKEMETEQIIDAFDYGLYDGGENVPHYNMNAEKYYKDTYEK
jgi:hypothetical protein